VIPSVANGTITIDSSGAVTLDDEDSPLIVTVASVSRGPGRPRQITELNIRVRRGDQTSVNPKVVARLPIKQMIRVALPGSHPDDAIWKSLVRDKSPGQKSWPESHWPLVADVCRWAKETRRDGGATMAISDLWLVSRATAGRWMMECRWRHLLP
jgi:hypothetical protein